MVREGSRNGAETFPRQDGESRKARDENEGIKWMGGINFHNPMEAGRRKLPTIFNNGCAKCGGSTAKKTLHLKPARGTPTPPAVPLYGEISQENWVRVCCEVASAHTQIVVEIIFQG